MAISEKKKRIQVTLSKKMTKKLEDYSDFQGLSKSQIIEIAVSSYFDKQDLTKMNLG